MKQQYIKEYLLYCVYNQICNILKPYNLFENLINNALNDGWMLYKLNNKIIMKKNIKKNNIINI